MFPRLSAASRGVPSLLQFLATFSDFDWIVGFLLVSTGFILCPFLFHFGSILKLCVPFGGSASAAELLKVCDALVTCGRFLEPIHSHQPIFNLF